MFWLQAATSTSATTENVRLGYAITENFYLFRSRLLSSLRSTSRRREVKRYGVLFTCLTTRVVHVEVVRFTLKSSILWTLDPLLMLWEGLLRGEVNQSQICFGDGSESICRFCKKDRSGTRLVTWWCFSGSPRKNTSWFVAIRRSVGSSYQSKERVRKIAKSEDQCNSFDTTYQQDCSVGMK